MKEDTKSVWRRVGEALSADNTDRGYAQGFPDGLEGRRARPADYRHIRPFNFVWGFDHAADTYTKGYEKAYTDGSRKRAGLFETDSAKAGVSISNAGVSGMSAVDSYQRQLQLLENLNRQLQALDNAVTACTERYHKQIEAAAAQGFMTNYTDQLRTRYQEFLRQIERLREVIEKNRQLLLRHEDVINERIHAANQP